MIFGEPSLEGFSMDRQGLGSAQFARIEKLLPGRPGYVGRGSELGSRLLSSDHLQMHPACARLARA